MPNIDTRSYEAHREEYKLLEVSEKLRETHKSYFEDFINKQENPLPEVIKAINGRLRRAVDIGSGEGWITDYLAQNFGWVYSIEPSWEAMKVAKQLYKHRDNISWINGFAEEHICRIKLREPALFVTGCVLSHLSDEAVSTICSEIDKIAPETSLFSFMENHGIAYDDGNLWHSRTEGWWKQQFPGWKLKFRYVPGSHKGIYKGIVGAKS